MIKKTLLLGLLSVGILNCYSQSLLTPSRAFSHQKPSTITLTDGSEIKGTIGDIDRKKGLIAFIKIEDQSGKKHKLKPEQVKYMYLPPSGLDNLGKAMDFLTDAKKWNDEKLDQDLLNQGYAYFENAKVKMGKKETTMLMQLLNPGFSKVVKVYHDPLAKETMAMGVGGINVAGGDAKSYFIKLGEAPAYKLEKKNYDKEFAKLWGSCDNLKTSTDKKWLNLTKHIIQYSECAK